MSRADRNRSRKPGAPDRVASATSPVRLLARHDAEPFLVTPTAVWSRGEAALRTRQVATRLRQAGVAPGDRVALATPATAAALLTLLATWELGATLVPLHLREPHDLLASRIAALDCRLVVGTSVRPSGASCPLLPADASLWQGAAATGDSPPAAGQTILGTSGTRGPPRLVVHDWAQHVDSARVVSQHLAFGAGARWLLSLPLYHVGGLAIVVRAVAGGGALVVVDEPLRGELLRQLAVTHISLVATQLRRLLRGSVAGDELPLLRAVVVGGGPLSDSLVELAVARRLPLVHTYGCTEMASMVTATPLGLAPGRPLDAGGTLPGRTLLIASDGEILVGGTSLFRGYLDPATDRVAVRLDHRGLFATGDLGELSARGTLRVLGRRDNRMISGGENIQAEEIESACRRCPAVLEAIVVALPDEEFGQRPVAFVRLEPGHTLEPEALRAALSARLPRFKVPDRIWTWPDATRTGRGGLKPDRTAFARLAAELAMNLEPTRDVPGDDAR